MTSTKTIFDQVIGDIVLGDKGLDASLAEIESGVIRKALDSQMGNRSAAARQLKLPRQTLQDRMRKHELQSYGLPAGARTAAPTSRADDRAG